jgi:hypothetical protein
MIDALDVQAQACLSLGSKMYHDLLQSLRANYLSRGITYQLLHNASERPMHDATPLRLLGALHRIVLSGADPQLAQHYESVGGTPTDSLTGDVLRSIESHFHEISVSLQQQVQTNEPGRALCHLALSHWLSHIEIGEFSLLEVGASAGLTMSFDRYGVKTPLGVAGDSSSSLLFPEEWVEHDFPFHQRPAQCQSRRGVDLSPIDIATDEGVNKLLSFVWPDQHERFARLQTAIDITRRDPHIIDSASVDHWLPTQLTQHSNIPVVIFHSIVWQYLGRSVQESMKKTLQSYGAATSKQAPLIWARMEPAGRVADLQVTIWDGSETPHHWNLGTIGYHGQSLRWSPQRLS